MHICPHTRSGIAGTDGVRALSLPALPDAFPKWSLHLGVPRGCGLKAPQVVSAQVVLKTSLCLHIFL